MFRQVVGQLLKAGGNFIHIWNRCDLYPGVFLVPAPGFGRLENVVDKDSNGPEADAAFRLADSAGPGNFLQGVTRTGPGGSAGGLVHKV